MLYPGRVFLGVGTGEAPNEQAATGEWGSWDKRAARRVEAIQIIRRLWDGERVTLESDFFKLQNAHLYDLPEQKVPIYVSAMGPQAMRVAGEHGDGLVTASSKAADPELLREFQAGVRAAGKDPASMPILAELFVFVGRQEDAPRSAEKWRCLPNAWTKYVERSDPRDIWHQAQDEVPIDQVIKMMTIGGDPQIHANKLQQLIDAGVTHILVHSGQEDQQRVIDFYGRDVLPRLRHDKLRPGV